MRTLVVVWAITAMVATVLSSVAGTACAGELLLSLPADGAVRAEWVSPPLPAAEARETGFGVQRFRLDRHLAPWVLHDGRTITSLATGAGFTTARPVRDFIWLADGALLLAGETSLGTLAPVKQGGEVPAKSPVVQFQPIIPLPVEGGRLAGDGKDGVFVFGYDPALRGHAVFRLARDFTGWQRLFVTGEPIADVCFDGTTLSVAAGRVIHRLRPGDPKSLAGSRHPLDNLTGLACSAEGGPFFATATGVGGAGGATVEFAKVRQAQIEARQGALYLFVPETLGVLRLGNAQRMLPLPAP